MNAIIAATVYSMVSIAAAYIVLPKKMFCGLSLRALGVWCMGVFVLFFLGDPLFQLLLMMVIIIALSPFHAVKRTAFFFLVIAAFPIYFSEPLPFPGIDHLIVIDYYKICVISLLVLLFIIPRNANVPNISWGVVDTFIIGYVVYTSIQLIYTYGLTNGFRVALDQFILIALPYFALTRILTRTEDLDECLRAFLASAVILGVITLTATALQWDFYRLKEPASVFAIPDIRGGFLRIQATITTHSLAYYLASAAIFIEYFKNTLQISTIRLWALRVILLTSMYFPGSRGAMTGFVIACAVYIVLSVKSTTARWVLISAGSVFGLVAAYVLMFGQASEYDTYGSFNYRQQLLDTSIDFIADYPLFGNVLFLETGRFNHLVQGQGIVDVTNLYLQIGLNHGLLGMLLFFMPILLTIFRLGAISISSAGEAEPDELSRAKLASIICAISLGWLALIATTSSVGLTLHLGLVNLALGHAIIQQDQRAKRSYQSRSDAVGGAGYQYRAS